MQPYDPHRIPLIMVHGLQSTPIAFANLLNELQADPVIGARYQIWHYHYPTGTAVLRNAAVMRRIVNQTLRQIDPEGDDFATNHLVVLGHSMGGILSHTLVCDSGYKLWDSIIRVRPDKLRGPVAARKEIEDFLIFKRDKRVRRVIFVSVPHRGSATADHWLGRLGNSLLHPDESLLQRYRPLLALNEGAFDPFVLNLLGKGKFSSIRTLSPKSPTLKALATIPPAVPFHSIMGQLGMGDLTKSGDGFVKYASSHLEGAESEFIVHSGHNSFRNAKAVEEIKRILRFHLHQ
jgi:pimeloyl-ACP methyl ester carboxylesterase